MRFSKNKTIIEYIPIFLEYCKKEKHFLPKSIENYYRFLKRFITYLRNSHKKQLLPHQLSAEHIQSYKLYLSKTIHPVTKKPISKVTQNFYLIAVRALLFYFLEKDIRSLLPDKIKLLKQDDYKIKNILLTLKQLKKLLSAPNTSKINGLRDRVILEILLSTGLNFYWLKNKPTCCT
jgi:integrase/recombinase XerD